MTHQRRHSYLTDAQFAMLMRLRWMDGSLEQTSLSPSQIAMMRHLEERHLVARTHYSSWFILDNGRAVVDGASASTVGEGVNND